MNHPNFEWEKRAKEQGYLRVAGIDEAGRGPLAGPLVVAGCLLPQHFDIEGVNDSKQLNEAQRTAIFEKLIHMDDFIYAIEVISPEEIDKMNILGATLYGMRKVAIALSERVDCFLIDGNKSPSDMPHPTFTVVGGDALSLSIAAASILAKVTRDRLMLRYDEIYPDYQFKNHKGYPTSSHIKILARLGPTPIHRRSYRRVAAHFENITVQTG